jgi:hypothetical protein
VTVSRSGALLGLLAAGIGLAALAGMSAEPERKGVTVPPPEPPPLQLSPKGRYLTPFERAIMSRYFKPEVLNATRLWFGRPPSSFPQEGDVEAGVTTEALTTKDGIYFRFENHELHTPEEFALLAHELVHVEQFMGGPIPSEQKAPNEVVAQRMQIAVKKDLDENLGSLFDGWQGVRYA